MAELRLDVLTEPLRTGLTVTEVCRRYEISRQTYYRYRSRYLAADLPGLEDRSRRPDHPGNQIPAELEVRIVGMRRDHPRWGARRIRAELTRAGVDPPAVVTNPTPRPWRSRPGGRSPILLEREVAARREDCPVCHGGDVALGQRDGP